MIWHNWCNYWWLNFSLPVVKHKSLHTNFNELSGDDSRRWNSPVSIEISLNLRNSLLIGYKLVKLLWELSFNSLDKLVLDSVNNLLLEQALEGVGNLRNEVSTDMDVHMVTWNVYTAGRYTKSW